MLIKNILHDQGQCTVDCLRIILWRPLNSLTTKKPTTKFSSANFQKNIKSKLYHIEDSKTNSVDLDEVAISSYIILRIKRLKGKQCRSR